MKFKEYIEQLNKLAQERPETLEYEVVSASDEEGNSFTAVNFTPTVGYHDGEYIGEFISEDDPDLEEECNSVCIN